MPLSPPRANTLPKTVTHFRADLDTIDVRIVSPRENWRMLGVVGALFGALLCSCVLTLGPLLLLGRGVPDWIGVSWFGVGMLTPILVAGWSLFHGTLRRVLPPPPLELTLTPTTIRLSEFGMPFYIPLSGVSHIAQDPHTGALIPIEPDGTGYGIGGGFDAPTRAWLRDLLRWHLQTVADRQGSAANVPAALGTLRRRRLR